MRNASQPFLIAPWIGLESITCWNDVPQRAALLALNGLRPSVLVQNLLDSLQPPDSRQEVRAGYMIGIGVFDLFTRKAGGWEFDDDKFRFFADLFLEVGRPVVVHLRANHFAGESELVKEMLLEDSSFARTNDGSAIREVYYTNTLFAPTFSLDSSIPFNRYRFGGFRSLAERLADFDRRHPGLIHAFTLAGELHHLVPGLANPSAAGQFEGIRMTDYSDASVRDFRRWLQSRHGAIERVNEQFGTAFTDWDRVEPPRHDLRRTEAGEAWTHMDSYADGVLPVFGWAELPPGASIRIYVNGGRAGKAEYGLSRVDVYDALPRLTASDVGFRFALDFRDLPPGRHFIHAVMEFPNGDERLIGRRTIAVADENAGSHGRWTMDRLDKLPPLGDAPGAAACLDHPPEGLLLRFNPYAAEWQRFREWQVRILIGEFARLAIEAGLPPDRVYSHHISPQLEGSWNQVVFALPADALRHESIQLGLSLYGGATVSRSIEPLTAGLSYGVCEFHPRMGRLGSREVFRRSLEYHYKSGAAFLCPYYMCVIHPQSLSPSDVSSMLITPISPIAGSLFFYSALIDFLNRPARQ